MNVIKYHNTFKNNLYKSIKIYNFNKFTNFNFQIQKIFIRNYVSSQKLRHDPNLIIDEDSSTRQSVRDDTLKLMLSILQRAFKYSITIYFMILLVGTEPLEEKLKFLKYELTFQKYAKANLVLYQHNKILRIYERRESLRIAHIEKMKKRFERREKLRLWKRKWKYNLGILKERPNSNVTNCEL